MRGGRVCFQRRWGPCWCNHIQKVSCRSSSGDGGGQTLRGRPFCHMVLATAEFVRLIGELERFVFKVEKLWNGKNDLRTVKSEAQNQSEKTVTAKKGFVIVNLSLEADGLLLMPIRHFFARICSPGSLLHILTEISLSSQTTYLSTPPFSLQKNAVRWQIAVLLL
jgi:hypothetical protein